MIQLTGFHESLLFPGNDIEDIKDERATMGTSSLFLEDKLS